DLLLIFKMPEDFGDESNEERIEPDAKRKRISRQNETEEQRSQRLEGQRQKQRALRANESPEQHAARLHRSILAWHQRTADIRRVTMGIAGFQVRPQRHYLGQMLQ